MSKYSAKICKICGKEFMPNSAHQVYCKDTHYRICPICGKSYAENNLDKFKYPPTTCSVECRVKKRTQTSLEKYGISAPGNNPDARRKAKQTMNDRYGVNYAQESKEIRKKSINTWIENYGVDNPQKCADIQKKTADTNIERYGSKSYLTSKEGKEVIDEIMLNKYGTTVPLRNPSIQDRQIATNIERYGIEYPILLPEMREKAKQTSLQKYGTEYPQSSEIVKQRTKDTFIRNYGVDNCFKSKEIIEKIHKAFFEHYGVDAVMNSPEIADRIRETNMKRYGVPYGIMLSKARKSSGVISKTNRNIIAKLNTIGISTKPEHTIGNQSYDIYIPQSNMLIEIDPTYTHNTVGNHWNSNGISKDYHLKKTLQAIDAGYRCIHLWDWDSSDKFISSLTTGTIIYNKLYPEIINKTEATEFIQQYSLYDVTRNIQNIAYIGIRYKSKLMLIMGFKQTDPLLNTWELVCIENRFNYKVHNGNQIILDEFIHNYNPSKITCYVDFSKSNGEILENLGFEYTQFVLPNKIWSKGRHAIIDSPTIIPDAMILDHWLPVYNCGYKVYEKYLHTPKIFQK